MQNSNIAAVYTLTDTEKADVERIIRSQVSLYRPEDYDEFMSTCQSAANEFPRTIHNWSAHVQGLSVGLLRNLPIDITLPATPTVRHGADNIPLLADGVIGTISALFGFLYTFEGKTTSRHIHNVYPVYGDEYTQLGSGKVKLEWHVEDGFHPARPNWVSLLCLRGDTEAETMVARARDLRLSPDIVRTLEELRFKLRIDDSFTDDTHSIYVTTRILTGSTDDPQIMFDPAYTICQDDDETNALAAVESAADEVQQRFTLEEGDLLTFDNRRVMHARTAYRPRMDGKDRWLKRALVLETSEWSSMLNKGMIPFEIE
jgi:L-asparagine oxygenase